MISDVFNAFAALIFVIGLLGLFAWAVRRFGFVPGQVTLKTGKKHIELLESKTLDGRNRLVSVRWKGKDYLLATNPSGVRPIGSDTDDTDNSNSKAHIEELLSDNENN